MIDISPKTCEILDNFEQSSDKLLIMSGAYRSLKTTAASFAVLHIINKHPSGKFMILGKTLDSIKRNVVSSLIECLGGDNVIYKGGNSPSVYVCGKEFECIGCSDVKSAEIVKGSTRHGILVDEAIVIPKLTWRSGLVPTVAAWSRAYSDDESWESQPLAAQGLHKEPDDKHDNLSTTDVRQPIPDRVRQLYEGHAHGYQLQTLYPW